MPDVSPPHLAAVHRALDEARFGRDRILNLRASFPTAEQAVRRAEAWLRERQVARAGEVLVITGRGKGSEDGVSVVREAVVKLLASLRRRGVVAAVQEHTPGSFLVQLAPVTALRDAPRRRRERTPRPVAEPAALSGLSVETRALLRRLSQRALEELGVHDSAPFLEREMLAQLAVLTPAIADAPNREARLRDALTAALEEYEDR